MTTGRAVVALALLFAPACGDDSGGSAPVPTALELVGSYDLTTTYGGPPSEGVATVALDGELVLVLNVPPVVLRGALESDGTIGLAGMTTNSDAVLTVDGKARAEQLDGTLRIAGTLSDGSAFVMERGLAEDQSRASGRYRFRLLPSPQPLHGDSAIEVDLQVESNGRAIADSDGAERDTAGAQIAAVSKLFAVIAPNGRFTLAMQYDLTAGGTCSLGQHCRLDIAGVLPRAADDDPTPGTYSYQFDTPLFPISTGAVEVTRLGALP